MGFLDTHDIRLPQDLSVGKAVDFFESLCRLPIDSQMDMRLFETGEFHFPCNGKKEFYFSLVRQYKKNPEDDEYMQIHLDLGFAPSKETAKFHDCEWSDEEEGESAESFFQMVRGSGAYQYLTENHVPIQSAELYEEET